MNDAATNADTALQRRLLVTVSEGCMILAVKPTTMYEFINSGRIRIVRIGSRGVRVPVSELERFVAEGLGNE